MMPGCDRNLREFFETHYLEGLPSCARESTGELAEAGIIRDTPAYMIRVRENFIRIISEAGRIRGISCWASPGVADAIGERACAGIPVELIVVPRLAACLLGEPYREKVMALAELSHVTFLVTEEPVWLGLTVTDRCLSLGLFLKDGKQYDSRSDLICRAPPCLAWGERVFAWYRDRSVPLALYARSADSPP